MPAAIAGGRAMCRLSASIPTVYAISVGAVAAALVKRRERRSSRLSAMTALAKSEFMPPLALLAGGLATRLRPITEKIPKSMVQVAGEPFIAHQLRLLVREGVSDVVICTGYHGEQIEAYVGDGSTFACHVRYSADG